MQKIQHLLARGRSYIEIYGIGHSVYATVGVVAGLAVTVVAIIDGLARNFPLVYLIILAALALGATLWCVRQFFLLFGAPILTRPKPDYEYCLAYIGLIAAVDEGADGAIELGVTLQNASAWPLQYHVRAFRIVIGDRTIAEPTYITTEGGLLPRMTVRQYWYPSFGRDVIVDRGLATIEISIAYGPPGSPPLRLLTMKIKAALRIANGQLRTNDRLIEEKDEKCRECDFTPGAF